MTWLDYAVFGVLVVSVGWGIWRGLVREVVSLAAFVIAFLAANLFSGPLSDYVPASIEQPEFRVLLAYAAIFVLALVLTSLGGLILSKILKAAGLGGIDRGLGAIFGMARAALILLALALQPWLPPALAERLRYD